MDREHGIGSSEVKLLEGTAKPMQPLHSSSSLNDVQDHKTSAPALSRILISCKALGTTP